MSRIGLRPIDVPSEVEVNITGSTVTVKGSKGELTKEVSDMMELTLEDNQLTVARLSELKEYRALHGTTRSLIENMILGVQNGFEKHLEIIGVGYRASMQGKKLVVGAGYSHPVEINPAEGIEIEVPKNTEVIVRGIDKELVGATAANIRAIRTPEPYKGKGIRYKGEHVRRKEGKTAN